MILGAGTISQAVEMVTVDPLDLQVAQDGDAAAHQSAGAAPLRNARISSLKKGAFQNAGSPTMMERKIVCDLNLVSVDFGREEELRPGNTFSDCIPTRERPADRNDRGLSG